MNFKDCIDSYPFILMEGALGERLKREFDLDISGTVAMADLVYQQKGRLALETLWNEYIDIAYRYQLPFLQQLQQEGPIKNGFIWLDTMNPLLQIMWIFFVP